jgi:hypothetical protein
MYSRFSAAASIGAKHAILTPTKLHLTAVLAQSRYNPD